MSDAKFTLQINSEVEARTLTQMEASLEAQIAKARVLGQSFAEQEKQLLAVRARMQELVQANPPAAAPAAAAPKLADESERYAAALKQQADAAREAADAEALAALKTELAARSAARRQEELQETAYALSELSNLTKTYSQTEVDAITGVKDASDKATPAVNQLTASKKQLKDIVKGLSAEFPALASVLRLALNPVAFVVTGIASAFALWNLRVKELTVSLGGVQMPDIADSDIDRIKRMSAALSDAATKALDTSAADKAVLSLFQSERAMIQTQLDITLKLLAARKNLALAQDQTPQGRADTEARFAVEENQARFAAEDARIESMIREQEKLREQARQKIAAAGNIKTGKAGDEAERQNEERFRKLIEGDETGIGAAANKKQAEANLRDIQRQREMSPYDPRRVYFDNKFRVQYGSDATYDDAEAMERRRIADADRVFDQYRAFQAGQAARNALRATKKTGEEELKRADEMGVEIDAAIEQNKKRKAAQEEIDRYNRDAANIRAAEEQRKQDEQENKRKAREADEEIRARPNLSAADLSPIKEAGDAVVDELIASNDTLTAVVTEQLNRIRQTIADNRSKFVDSLNA